MDSGRWLVEVVHNYRRKSQLKIPKWNVKVIPLYFPHLQTHVKRPILQQEQKMKLTLQQTNYENKNPFINQFNSSYRSIG